MDAGGWSVRPLLAIAAGITFGVAFARRQHRLASPLLDLDLFLTRSFSAALVVHDPRAPAARRPRLDWGRNPARVIVTSRWTAASLGRLLAAVRAWRQ